MASLKNRLKIIESALTIIKPVPKFIRMTICTRTDDDVIGYECNGIAIERNPSENIDDLDNRSKAIFIERNATENNYYIVRSIYEKDAD